MAGERRKSEPSDIRIWTAWTTPVMEASLANHVWSIEEVIGLLK
jgi:hypothetical protein